jgi:hypothetical protein
MKLALGLDDDGGVGRIRTILLRCSGVSSPRAKVPVGGGGVDWESDAMISLFREPCSSGRDVDRESRRAQKCHCGLSGYR